MNNNHDNFSFSKIPQDIYNSSGVNVNELPREDKEEVISILRNEFLPN